MKFTPTPLTKFEKQIVILWPAPLRQNGARAKVTKVRGSDHDGKKAPSLRLVSTSYELER